MIKNNSRFLHSASHSSSFSPIRSKSAQFVLFWYCPCDSKRHLLNHLLNIVTDQAFGMVKCHTQCVFFPHHLMGFPIGSAVFIGSRACLQDQTDGRSPNVTTTLLAHHVYRLDNDWVLWSCACSVLKRFFLKLTNVNFKNYRLLTQERTVVRGVEKQDRETNKTRLAEKTARPV